MVLERVQWSGTTIDPVALRARSGKRSAPTRTNQKRRTRRTPHDAVARKHACLCVVDRIASSPNVRSGIIRYGDIIRDDDQCIGFPSTGRERLHPRHCHHLHRLRRSRGTAAGARVPILEAGGEGRQEVVGRAPAYRAARSVPERRGFRRGCAVTTREAWAPHPTLPAARTVPNRAVPGDAVIGLPGRRVTAATNPGRRIRARAAARPSSRRCPGSAGDRRRRGTVRTSRET